MKVRHHINESHDAAWGRSKQAISWLEDHVNGVQDVIAASTASLLNAEALAREAEASEDWWRAALRWNALGLMKTTTLGSHNAGNQYFKLAVAASSKARGTLTTAGGLDGNLSEFNLDSFDLIALNFVFKSWDKNNVVAFGDRFLKTVDTDAGRFHPIVSYAAKLSTEWFPALLNGNEQGYADANWNLTAFILDMCDESTEAYACSSPEDRALAKPMMAWTLAWGGDRILQSPGFSWDRLGKNGDKLVEHRSAYVYEDHHEAVADLISVDTWTLGSPSFVLTLQFGRLEDARNIMDDNLILTNRIVQFPGTSGFVLAVLIASMALPVTCYIHGLSTHIRKSLEMFGTSFDDAEERIETITKPMRGVLYTAMEHKGPDFGGSISSKRCLLQIQAFSILNGDVAESKAKAWLQSLPDDDDFIAYSMTFPTHDYSAVQNFIQTCWLALANEKYSMYGGALRFADVQLGPLSKAGAPLTKWPQVIALACKGRVLAKLDRHHEALAAFQAAIATSKESYSLMEAFAYRELANYAGGGDAAVHAGGDLEATLKTFEGRMTRAEFAELKIGP